MVPLPLNSVLLDGQQKVDRAPVDAWMKDLSNWGRWGKQDQLGAVNLITPAVRRRAAALVKEGVSISLSRLADRRRRPRRGSAGSFC